MFSAGEATKKDIYLRNRYVIDVQQAKENIDKRPKLIQIPMVSELKKKNYLFEHTNKYLRQWEVFVIIIACVNCF